MRINFPHSYLGSPSIPFEKSNVAHSTCIKYVSSYKPADDQPTTVSAHLRTSPCLAVYQIGRVWIAAARAPVSITIAESIEVLADRELEPRG